MVAHEKAAASSRAGLCGSICPSGKNQLLVIKRPHVDTAAPRDAPGASESLAGEGAFDGYAGGKVREPRQRRVVGRLIAADAVLFAALAGRQLDAASRLQFSLELQRIKRHLDRGRIDADDLLRSAAGVVLGKGNQGFPLLIRRL